MDQVKKILAQYFWILLGLVAILAPTGWYLGTAGLATETTTRTKAINDKFSALTSIESSNSNPNPSWSKALVEINTTQSEKVDEAWRTLWNHQVSLMKWDPALFKEQGDIEPKDPLKATPGDLENYRTNYPEYRKAVWQSVNPLIEGEEDPDTGEKTKTGLVEFDFAQIPNEGSAWDQLSAKPEEIRDVQEDLWLYQSILESLAKVNGQTQYHFNAPVRKIVTLQLRGGDKTKISKTGGGSATTAASTPAAAGLFQSAAESGLGGLGGLGAGVAGGSVSAGGGGADLSSKVSIVKFNPDDEWGSDAGEAAAATTAAAGAKPATNARKRYVDEDANKMWRTRGFYLVAVIDSDFLPTLVSELSNSRWPTRIVRVHQADLDDEVLADAANPQSSPTGGLMGGGSGGFNPEMMAKAMAGAGGGGAMGPGSRGGPGGATPGGINLDDDEEGFGGGIAAGVLPGTGGALPSAGMTGPQLANLKDPSLVVVAISGTVTLFLPPPAIPSTTLPVAGSPATPSTAVVTPSTSPPATTPAPAEPASSTTTPSPAAPTIPASTNSPPPAATTSPAGADPKSSG